MVLWGLVKHSTLDYDDLRSYFIPWRQMQYGLPGLSLWNPFEFAGMPMLADTQKQLLYPPNWIFSWVQATTAMDWYLALHVGLSATFTYRWLRLLELSRSACVVGGLTFSLSAFSVLHLSQLPVAAGTCWLPAGWLSIERLAQHPGRREQALAALYGALALLAGSPQILFISAWGWLAYAVWRGALRPLLATALAAVMVALPQLLASAEMLPWLLRAGPRTMGFVGAGSLPPWRGGWSLLSPYAFVNPAVHPDPSYTFHETTVYLGLVGLLLMVSSLASEHRQRTLWLGVLGVSFLLSLGAYTPIYSWLADWVPGFSMFRVPSRWMLLGSGAAAALTAFGLERLRGGWLLWGAALLMLGSLGLIKLLGGAVGWGPAYVLAFSLCAWRGPSHRVLLAGLVFADLAGFAAQYLRYVPVDEVYQPVALLGRLRPWPLSGRGIGVPNFTDDPRWEQWAMGFHLSDIQGNNPLALDETVAYFYTAASRQILSPQQAETLRSQGGSVRLPTDPGNPMYAMLDVAWAVEDRDRPRFDTLPDHWGPGWAVGKTRLADRETALLLLSRNQVDPRRVVLLESPSSHPEWDGAIEAQVRYVSYTCNQIEYDVTQSHDGWLITSEVYYPGWRAAVDGQDTPVVRADGLLRACWVPAGHHQVVVRFRPWWLPSFGVTGLALAALGWPFLRRNGGR